MFFLLFAFVFVDLFPAAQTIDLSFAPSLLFLAANTKQREDWVLLSQLLCTISRSRVDPAVHTQSQLARLHASRSRVVFCLFVEALMQAESLHACRAYW